MNKEVLKDIKQKVGNYLRNGITTFCVAAVSSMATYVICDHINERTLEELNEQIKQLKAEEQEARVTKRISEQMGEIASDQQKISDRQRKRAEYEARLADIARNTAEFERSKAQKAERAAKASAAHADSMSVIAENQRQIAIDNMEKAQQAKAQSDTLFYKSLSSSLAQSSIALHESEPDLSRLLAYASWHYATNYSDKFEDANVYLALLKAPSVSTNDFLGVTKGDIRSMGVVTVEGKRYAIGASDYGELIYIDSLNQPFFLHPSVHFYRDLTLASGHNYAALSADGEVSLIDYYTEITQHRIVSRETTLPNGTWRHIVASPDKTMLVALSDNMVVWLSSTDLHIIATATTTSKCTVLGYAENTLHIFGEDNNHLISTTPGELIIGGDLSDDSSNHTTQKTAEDKHYVTAYCYDEQHKYIILGYSCGDIEYRTVDGKLIRILEGHIGRITHLETDGDLLISTSLDYQARFWFVHNISSIIIASVQTFTEWPQTFTLDRERKTMWIGIADGEIQHLNYSAAKNAAITHQLLRREFTTEEWEYYIGPTIPYRTFINNNNE